MATQDYRVSTIVVLCKDCGNDVGLYPARHKCPPRPAMPAMPAIPSKYQQPSPSFSSSSSRSADGGSSGRMRPPDLNPNSLYPSTNGSNGTPGNSSTSSYGSGSRTPTSSSSSFQDRMNGSKTPTASSFQERMKERDRERQLREREERELAARGIREETRQETSQTTAAPAAAGSGNTLWGRLKAAKEVFNATITGEEKWPESDDSDYEGESHVGRILRDRADKKEEQELAAKIAELELNPYASTSTTSSLSKATGTASRNDYLRKDYAPSTVSSTSSGDNDDHYTRSLRARGELPVNTGPDLAERSWSPSVSSANTTNSGQGYGSNNSYNNNNNNNNLGVSGGGNRYRTSSDASRDDALSRLEGKSQGDKLAAQVSHLGSTSPRARANSPMGHRQDNQHNNSGSNHQLSPSSANYQPSPSPGSGRRYDPPSPSPRFGGQGPSSPSYGNNNSGGGGGGGGGYRPQQGPPPPSDPYEYDRRPTYPPGNSGGGPPPGVQGYGQQRQPQYQQYQQPQQYQQHNAYGSNRGNYF
ncbi:hypothetical protein BGW38_006038 [Lunasporangiospora selenospora]|uniref:Uncharacterized protein n=1 Tax=Lunasporangiospora selenospora TaxID=979761 RepID=A0A9P6KB34_9FUNG|nr:hypothetical protein BGW38_006038 [Lunasporangiospora selenospora]